MDTKILAGMSAAALGAGCFILGAVAGLSFAGKGCKDCALKERYSREEEPDEETSDGDCKFDEDLCELAEKRKTYANMVNVYLSNDAHYGLLSKEEQKDDAEPEYISEILRTRQISDGIEVITVDAYLQGIEGYTQTTLVWFEQDETMIDNRDEMIPMQEWESAIGMDKVILAKTFGELSDDNDVVYIRNRHLMYEYEVICEHSSYAKCVLGVGPEDAEYDEALKFFGIDEEKREE